MNNLAISPYIGLHALQLQNVKRNVVKKASISNLNNENEIIHSDEIHHNNETDNHEIDNHDIEIDNHDIEIDNHDIEIDNHGILPEPLFDNNVFGSEIN
jgi:hypothetical protein